MSLPLPTMRLRPATAAGQLRRSRPAAPGGDLGRGRPCRATPPGGGPASDAKSKEQITPEKVLLADDNLFPYTVDGLPYPDVSIENVMQIPTLRKKLKKRPHPLRHCNNFGSGFVGDRDIIGLNTVRYESVSSSGASCVDPHRSMDPDAVCTVGESWAIRSGPRADIYWEPASVTAAVVTCGGLCPGLNDIIESITLALLDYGVPEDQILGIKYGLRGFTDRNIKPVPLTRERVEGIHLKGGTMLGTSRGNAGVDQIVKKLDLWGIDMLYVLGGNGGNAAAWAIHEECIKQGVLCSVVAVPKSIDNDILVIDRTFGFETAVEEAQRAILAAKVEASSARNGIGVVRLMGRQSGFVALNASLATGVVDICLIPEVKFEMEGKNGLMAYIEEVLATKGHCVICVAEGAGQDILADEAQGTDPSGNPILEDVGAWLSQKIKDKFAKNVDVKYIDPTYMIRAIPTTANDRIYCTVLGQGAVHAAFAGYTGITTGLVNTHFCYLPIPAIIAAPRLVDPRGRTWNRLKMQNGQPDFLNTPEDGAPWT
ncbi:unnamed protein product [Pedinophyceae sp. YPF-701]|nr:unnamed protein product [Pedinophyceae sp. YPF-701]